MHGTTTYRSAGPATMARAVGAHTMAPAAWRRGSALAEAAWLRRWGTLGRADWLLLRAVLVAAALLALVLLAGLARRALGMPGVTVAAATGVMWLVGCAGVLGWAAIVLVGASRDPSVPSRPTEPVPTRPRQP